MFIPLFHVKESPESQSVAFAMNPEDISFVKWIGGKDKELTIVFKNKEEKSIYFDTLKETKDAFEFFFKPYKF